MEILLLRIAFAPLLVLLVSLVARRVGPRLGGRLLGAPTTSGPFLAVLCVGSGTGAAANAAHGSAAGQLSVACFCFTYGRIAPRRRPAQTLVLALAAVTLAGAVEILCGDDVLVTAVPALVLILLNVPSLPTRRAPRPELGPESEPGPTPLSNRAIGARMVLSGVLVLTSVTVARAAGPFAGGMLSALPVLLAVMAPALHRTSGAVAAADLVCGALTSGAATIAFLLVLCAALVPLGAPAAFALAVLALAAADLAVRRTAGLATAPATRFQPLPIGARRARRRCSLSLWPGLPAGPLRSGSRGPAPVGEAASARARWPDTGRLRRIQSADPHRRPRPDRRARVRRSPRVPGDG